MTAMNPVNEQEHYRTRDDTTAADPGTPTWITTEDQSAAEVIDTDKDFRIRFVIANTGDAIANADWTLRVSKNSGSYNVITTTSADVQSSSTASSSADDTTLTTANFQLTAGTGTAAIGQYDENGALPVNLSAGDFFEIEWGLTIVDADVNDADTLDFRVYYNSAALDVYDITPRVEVNKMAGTTFQATCTAPISFSAGIDTQAIFQGVITAALTVLASVGASRRRQATLTAATIINATVDALLKKTATLTAPLLFTASASAILKKIASVTANITMNATADALRTTQGSVTTNLSLAATADATIAGGPEQNEDYIIRERRRRRG